MVATLMQSSRVSVRPARTASKIGYVCTLSIHIYDLWVSVGGRKVQMKLKIWSCVDDDHPFANPGCYLCRARSAVRGRVAVCQVQKRTRVMRRAQASKNVGKSDVGSAVASGAVVSGALCASPALAAQQVWYYYNDMFFTGWWYVMIWYDEELSTESGLAGKINSLYLYKDIYLTSIPVCVCMLHMIVSGCESCTRRHAISCRNNERLTPSDRNTSFHLLGNCFPHHPICEEPWHRVRSRFCSKVISWDGMK